MSTPIIDWTERVVQEDDVSVCVLAMPMSLKLEENVCARAKRGDNAWVEEAI